MLINAVWENCSFLNGEWSNHAITSYWVEVSEKEIDLVLSFLKAPKDRERLVGEIEDNRLDSVFFLLVSKDLASIVCMPHFYPFSPQWNGYSPFKEISSHEIFGFEDLRELDI
jgi:hypothetical protein